MKLDRKTGWCDGLRQLPSPNFDQRPTDCEIDLLVIHAISLPPGQFGTGCIDALFSNTLDGDADPYFADICDLRVSSHFLIHREGGCTQYVSVHDRAWHAGESTYQGRTTCNDFSIGVELEGCDDIPFTQPQYKALVQLSAELIASIPSLSREHIAGHSDIAPGRKTDPGPHFDWTLFRSQLSEVV